MAFWGRLFEEWLHPKRNYKQNRFGNIEQIGGLPGPQ